jgi:hypothetical protein
MRLPRQGRLVVLVNGAVGVALIAVIAAVSVTRQDARPPSLSEFAPAAGRALHQPHATAGPASPTRPVRPSAVPVAPPVGRPGVPRQLSCWAWPDGSATQTFDPQSPPCVSGWDVARGNGGATAPGVTGTAVRVGVPASTLAAARRYAAFFNSHFQLYGRSLQVVDLGRPDLSSDTGQQAAARAATEQRLFASLVPPVPQAGPAAAPTQYLDATAAARVISVLTAPSSVSSTGLSALAPFVWSYAPALDRLQQAAGGVACELLAGRRAAYSSAHAKDSRRFGIVVPDADHAGGTDLDVQTVVTALADCHSPARLERIDPTSPGAAQAALLRLKVAGVTTVLPYVSSGAAARVLLPAAEEEGFRPEWLLPGTDAAADPSTWAEAPGPQLRGLFGLATWQHDAGITPAVQAAGSGAPDDAVYHAMLVLASGIQTAGPALTPDAFARGLSGASFPDPGAGASPLFQAGVGFDDLDHAMVDDVALAWWQPGSRRFCLAGGGTRWGFASPPANDPGLFSPTRGCG